MQPEHNLLLIDAGDTPAIMNKKTGSRVEFRQRRLTAPEEDRAVNTHRYIPTHVLMQPLQIDYLLEANIYQDEQPHLSHGPLDPGKDHQATDKWLDE